MGLLHAKPVATPAMEAQRRRIEDQELQLDPEAATEYRSNTCLLLYPSHDIPEVQHAVRELTQDLRVPNEAAQQRLKRLTRYMIGTRDHGMRFPVAGEPRELLVSTDTDWAGDKISRKSCTCITIQSGGCTLATQCVGQAIHAQSSGESEFYGNVSGASSGLLVQEVLRFLGLPLKLVLQTDSAASRGILNISGVGKIRHLEVKTLWIQQLVATDKITIRPVPGVRNPADIGTKVLGRERMVYLMQLLNIRKTNAVGDAVSLNELDQVSSNTKNNEQVVARIVGMIVKTMNLGG